MEMIERYSVNELEDLQILADDFIQSSPYSECKWLYRNKSKKYFKNIQYQHKGWMNTILKDAGGDMCSPINGCVKGLFFSASVEPGCTDSRPIETSPFGTTRISIEIAELVEDTNLYFADFYCMGNGLYTQGKCHYVTLVVCQPGSVTDAYCSEFLLPLEWQYNNFLCESYSTYYVACKKRFLVEVFYTENINISRLISEYKAYMTYDVETFGQVHLTVGGKPKNETCTICNIEIYDDRYDYSARAQDADVENLKQEYRKAIHNRNNPNNNNIKRKPNYNMHRDNLYNDNMHFSNMHIRNMHNSNMPSSNMPSSHIHSSNMPTGNMLSSNMHSSNMHSSNMRSSNMPSSNTPSSNMPSSNTGNMNSSNIHSKKMPSSNMPSNKVHISQMPRSNMSSNNASVLPVHATSKVNKTTAVQPTVRSSVVIRGKTSNHHAYSSAGSNNNQSNSESGIQSSNAHESNIAQEQIEVKKKKKKKKNCKCSIL